MKIFLISSIILLVLTGCRKSRDETTIEYFFLNEITNEPIANVEVYVYETTNKHTQKSELFWQGKTNSEGKASVTFNALKKSNITYDFYVDKEKLAEELGYSFDLGTQPFPGQIKKNEYTLLDYKIRPISYMRKKYHNLNCSGPNDSLVLVSRKEPLKALLQINGAHVGCVDYESEFYPAFMGNYEYKFRVIRNGVDSTFTRSFYLEPNANFEFTVDY